MKNKNLTQITSLVVLVTMIAISMVSATLAKYTSEFSGTDTAIVAKWVVNLKDLNNSDLETFNLFDRTHVYDLDGLSAAQLADLSTVTVPTVETDVATGETNTIIAPGTWGKVGFNVIVGKDTQVSVNYGVDITAIENTSNIPIEFSTDGKNWTTDPDDLSNAGTVTLAEIAAISDPNTSLTRTATLYWRWVYDGNDTNDTNLGKAVSAPVCNVTATFNATQAN